MKAIEPSPINWGSYFLEFPSRPLAFSKTALIEYSGLRDIGFPSITLAQALLTIYVSAKLSRC